MTGTIAFPVAHRNDPLSSFHAAGRMKDAIPKQRRHVLELVRLHPGLTSKELAAVTGEDRPMIGRRLHELEHVFISRTREPFEDCRWWPIEKGGEE